MICHIFAYILLKPVKVEISLLFKLCASPTLCKRTFVILHFSGKLIILEEHFTTRVMTRIIIVIVYLIIISFVVD